MILDIIEFKICKLLISKAKRKPTNVCKILFLINKSVDVINVLCIFHNQSVKAWLLIDIKFDDCTFVYLLSNRIKSKIFDFYKFIHNLDVKTFLKDNSILPYNCEGSDFRDK